MELQGVGASAERKLREIQSLVDYFDAEMGVLAGRLMLAVSLLRDARSVSGLAPEVRAAIEHGEALAVSVMTRILAESGGGCGCGKIEEEVQALLDRHGGAS